MSTKSLYNLALDETKRIAETYKLSQEMKKTIETVQNQLDNFVIKVPIVGGFNAGKSSMINTFLGSDILPVEVLPETAIAAEITYGPNRVIAYDFDGKQTTFPLDDIQKIDANTYRFIEVQIESPKLKELDDIVLVDMPGFDSSIDEHNKAIFQYLQEGTVFLIAVECADGVLKPSVSNFLYELETYQLNFGVMVTKEDKVTVNMKNQVVNNIDKVVKTMNPNAKIFTASDRLEHGSHGLVEFLNGLDKEELFMQQFHTKILQIIERVKMNLEVMVNNANANTEDINKNIARIERKIKQLQEDFKKEEIQITHKIRNDVKENILQDVQSILMSESQNLANSAKAGETQFNQKVNELVRPILISSTNQQLELTFSDLLDRMNDEIMNVSSIASGVSNAKEAMHESLSGIRSGIGKFGNSEEDSRSKYNKLFKASIGSLAIISSVVAPWIELIIFFLPDILKVFGVNNEEKQLEKMKNQIESQVIPQIVAKVRENIGDSLEQVKDEMLEELKQEIEETMQDLRHTLHQSMDDKQKVETENQQYMDKLNEEIQILGDWKHKLT